MQVPINQVLSSKPFYIDFLAQSLEHLLMFRTGAEYAMQNQSYLAQRRNEEKRLKQQKLNGESATQEAPLDIADASLIKGNLARLVLTCDDKSWGVDWIAPSFQIKKAVLKAFTSERSQIVLTADEGLIRVHATQCVDQSAAGGGKWENTQWSDSFVPALQADCEPENNRTHDSEHLLLNYLHHKIENGDIQQRNGEPGFLSIVSERIPCASCTRNIGEFLREHSWINLRLFYFHDTAGRGPQQFLNECTGHRISAIQKIALQSVVHEVRVDGNPEIVLSERVVEQQKMFGGAPNQISSAIKIS